MLSRRLVTTFPLLKTLGRASSTVSSTPTPPAPASESSVAHQSPNYPTTWSTAQKPRPASRSGPRFEQTVMELQPNPLSAMELVANEPIRVVHGRKALCDGGKFNPRHLFYLYSLACSRIGQEEDLSVTPKYTLTSFALVHLLVTCRFSDTIPGSTRSSIMRVCGSLFVLYAIFISDSISSYWYVVKCFFSRMVWALHQPVSGLRFEQAPHGHEH